LCVPGTKKKNPLKSAGICGARKSIIHNGKKVDLPGTFKFWTELKWLLRW
jgi:hypothetical protein